MTDRADRTAPPIRTVADVDTGIDDALALLWLAARHRAGDIDLHVTTSAGNTTAALAARNSAEVLRVAGVEEVPVTVGASRPRVLPLTTTPETHGPDGLGYWTPRITWPGTGKSVREGTSDDAVEAWAEASPERILVAGPATNLARAVETAPELLRDVRVVLMSGAFLCPGNTTPTAEWNAWSDPQALAYCLDNWPADAPLPVICPLNVTEQVVLTPEKLAGWTAASPPEQAAFLDAVLRFYMEFHASVGVGYVAQIHDLAAAMVLCRAVEARVKDATVRVGEDEDLFRGTTVADWVGATAQGEDRRSTTGGGRGDTGPYWRRQANARIVTHLDPGAVVAGFTEEVVSGWTGAPGIPS